MHRFFVAALAALSFAVLAHPEAAAAAGPGATSATPAIQDFLKRDAFAAMKISPTGEYIAATVPLSDRTILVILRRSDLTVTGHVKLEEHQHVEDFHWVNDTHILFDTARRYGYLEAPQWTGYLFSVDVAGNGVYKPLARGVTLLDTLRDNDDEVLVVNGWSVGRLPITPGSHFTEIARSPVKNGGAAYLDDAAANVRFAWGNNSDRKVKTYYRDNDKAKWELINDEADTGIAVTPVGFSGDGKTAYLQVEEKDGPDGIYAFDTATRKREIVYRDDNTSPTSYLRSPEDGSVYAAVYEDGLTRVEYLDPANPYARQLRSIQAGFKDAIVIPTSYSKDGALGLYIVYADRVPADYYLFDRAAHRATYVASRAKWFKPDMLSPMRPVSFKARDGLPIEGFLTLPRGSDGKNLPLVVNPHGGPFGIADVWGYESEVQLLASRGYAVLQVNFRGSGNYGRAFEHAGYKQWGGAMQDDVTDATRWAIDQGIADPDRICIYGASYGAYAALMGVAKEPSLYRCAVGYVGVYDMELMYHAGDIDESMYGHNFLTEALGEQNLGRISPDQIADRIQVPVMLVAGREDRRAPAKHTLLMRDALLAAHKQVDAKIYEKEGHGFYIEADNLDFYTRLLAFLDRNTAPRAPAQAAAPTH